MRKGITISVTPADRVRLDAIARDHNSPQKHVCRARIIVLTADGKGTEATPGRSARTKPRSDAGRSASCMKGSRGLPATRPGPRVFRRCRPRPSTHWSARAMAQAVGISPSSVRRIWAGQRLQPRRVRAFKISNDPKFADKLKDVVGLYLDPPAHAVVLSIEKSQIQALDRTQPGLPMKKGRCATMTHDYKRNGTTTPFAALNVLEGRVIGCCMQRHRHQEFIRFLNTIEREVAADKAVHVVLDNYATHKHPRVRIWLARHPRFTFRSEE